MAGAGTKPTRTKEQRDRLRRRNSSLPRRRGLAATRSATKRIASAAHGCGGGTRCRPRSRPSRLTIVKWTRPSGQQTGSGSSAITTTTGIAFRTDNADDYDCGECTGAGAVHVSPISTRSTSCAAGSTRSTTTAKGSTPRSWPRPSPAAWRHNSTPPGVPGGLQAGGSRNEQLAAKLPAAWANSVRLQCGGRQWRLMPYLRPSWPR